MSLLPDPSPRVGQTLAKVVLLRPEPMEHRLYQLAALRARAVYWITRQLATAAAQAPPAAQHRQRPRPARGDEQSRGPPPSRPAGRLHHAPGVTALAPTAPHLRDDRPPGSMPDVDEGDAKGGGGPPCQRHHQLQTQRGGVARWQGALQPGQPSSRGKCQI